MNILFGGCSYTYGDELDESTREKERYSHIVCKHFGANEINVAEVGMSIPKTIYSMHNQIKNNPNIDLCVVQITFTNRLALPLFHKIMNVNTFVNKFDKRVHSHINEKQYKNLLGKMISSTNNYKIGQNYLDIHCPHLKLFEDSCKLRNVKTLYFCAERKGDQRSKILKSCPNLDILDEFFMNHALENSFPIGRYNHPLKEAHESFAKNILIPEIEKRL